jgi:hypothetical protein
MTGAAVDVVTGELVPITAARLTTAEAAEAATWLREMMRSVLTEGMDYGTIPGTKKPTLFKPGAEMLVLAAGMRFDQQRLDDEDAREHRGITYRCTVYRGEWAQAVCEGYAGYDERNYYPGTTSWNTIIKMAQKRALVGAALNAVAGSGLFAADLDDSAPADSEPGGNPPARNRGPRAGSGVSSPAPEPPVPTPAVEGTAEIAQTLNGLSPAARKEFKQFCAGAHLAFPPTSAADATKMLAELAAIAQRAAEDADAYGTEHG